MSNNDPTEASSVTSLQKEENVNNSSDATAATAPATTVKHTEKDVENTDTNDNDPPAKNIHGFEQGNTNANPPSTTDVKSAKEQANPIFEELKSAFPNIEDKYIKAVLIASQGVINPAFNALLYLSDPSFEKEAQLPPHPIHPGRSATQLQQAQLQQDELLARHLDEQYNQKRVSSARRPRQEHSRKQQAAYAHESDDDDDDFIETINRGLQETSKKVGMWWDGIKKNFAEDKDHFADPVHTRPTQNFRQRRFNSFGAHDDDVLSSHPRGNVSYTHPPRYVHQEKDEDDNDELPPKLPARKATTQPTETNDHQTNESSDTAQPKLWQPKPSQPSRAASKVSAISASHTPPKTHGPIKLDPDQDEFLINSDDEL